MNRGNCSGWMLKRILLISLLLAGGIIFMGCGRGQGGSTPDTKATGNPSEGEGKAVFAVATTFTVKGEINDYIELTGDVETQSNIDVYADTIGKLSRIYVSVGQQVTKDQVLAEVDPSRPGSNFVASPVKAPIGGTITALPLSVGTTISQGVSVAKIITLDQLQIKTFVAERHIAKMKVGQNAILNFEAYANASFTARVTELNPVVDPATRTMDVKLKLITPDARIKAGMFGRIKIITEEKSKVIKVPAESLVSRFDENYIFVIGDKQQEEAVYTAEKRRVVPGIRIEDKLEILEGLTAGEEIVLEGQTLLEDKSLVRVVKQFPPLAVAHEIK